MSIRSQPLTHLTRLAPQRRLLGNGQACLAQRFAAIACRCCVDTCPVGALSVGPGGFELGGDCVECGRCAAACPTRALSLGGFRLRVPQRVSATIEVECFKVPESACGSDSVRVPCTGALSTAQFLELASAGVGVAVIDRDWCAGCSAGGSLHPAVASMNEANALLEQRGAPAQQRVSFAVRPLPVGLRPDRIPEVAAPPAVSRRAFLGRLVGEVAHAREVAGGGAETIGEAPPPDGRARIVPAERLAIVAALRRIVGDGGRALPASLFRDIAISDRCHGHSLCATACPVAALQAREDPEDAGIDFDPLLCIGCGLCERHCPEGALRLTPAGAGPDIERPRPLVRHRRHACFDCGATFAGPRDEVGCQGDEDAEATLCPACRKGRDLGSTLFSGVSRSIDSHATIHEGGYP